MQVSLRKVGNSQAVIIPKAILLQLGLANQLEMEVQEDKIILSAPKNIRNGWAAAARQIAEQGDDELLDFPMDSEDEWIW
ncbi:Transcriptional regulator/antitoxin, MazE [Mannheimia sp. USDA-ARS-USMARC-1261]|uniref:AbrB/MazE/SpoVT family DNA-binding domain-containing protein n=1 Tax=Mannheimia TaxID=75984 RepID=UPI0003E3B78D|nr:MULTISPECIES: AbrB/MazE/SpoVT family DNA-binding domain-containing protein [Mannheimia]AHG72191.1 Transcriptional regulator/antitoxin, MazE [Mannheimia sp. USDA-ARS-USMARC-1261]AHG78676.1 Transcriptional regulator/antitoxin, MazE [Mannheimia varigena USDA-ARS-USMARC-1388]TLU75849.1 AbrB/MazE/SpoVT family DNA-binding domain-containing protein [Mannheimia varigena]